MKNILCYGDSNTWGYIAGSLNPELMLAKRYPYTVRWTGVLQTLLGDEFHIIEAGLNGRSTSFDETRIIRPSRNGLSTLPVIAEMHYPLDLIIFMLGTNDVKIEYNADCSRIVQGMSQLINFIKLCHLGPKFEAPKILLIAPAPLIMVDTHAFKLFFDNASVQKSQQLAPYYKKLADKENCVFLDAGQAVKIDLEDGVHFEQTSHGILAKALVPPIKNILAN